MINGQNYSWEDISIVLPHGELINVENIDYSDGKELEQTYGKGSNPVGYGVGNYSAESKITMLKEEYEKLGQYAEKTGKGIYRMKPFPVVVNYANDDQASISDTLRDCKVTKVSNSAGQGDKKVKVELELKVLSGILWNGREPN